MFLDPHHAWWSLDPTLDILSNFMREKAFNLPFSFASSKKDANFWKDSTFDLASYPLSYSPSNPPGDLPSDAPGDPPSDPHSYLVLF